MPRSWPQPFTSRPSTSTRPPLAVSSPMAIRSAVVLPQPDGPISETISPSHTVKLTRDSACTVCAWPPTRSEKRLETSTRLTSPIKNSSSVGWAKRSVPTISARGHGAQGARLCPPYASMSRQQRERLLARASIDHRLEVDRLRHAADAHRHLLDVVELVHRDRQIGPDRAHLDGPVVHESRARIGRPHAGTPVT